MACQPPFLYAPWLSRVERETFEHDDSSVQSLFSGWGCKVLLHVFGDEDVLLCRQPRSRSAASHHD